MSTVNLYSEFAAAYSSARLNVKNNDAKEARRYVIKCMMILADLHKASSSIRERAGFFARICSFKRISEILYNCGVNDEVRAIFGLDGKCSCDGDCKESDGRIHDIIAFASTQDWCADIFEKYKNSSVEITAISNGNSFEGTGFIISEKGYLLTNDHVVFDEIIGTYCKKISMKFQGDNKSYALQIVDSDKRYDVALCRFDVEKLGNIVAVPRIEDYSSVRQGEEIMIIGNPLSMGLSPVSGKIRYTHSKEGNLVYTALSNHGDSGGPVFNKDGKCIGINKSLTVSVTRGSCVIETQGMANATPMDAIDKLLDKWCKQKGIEL